MRHLLLALLPCSRWLPPKPMKHTNMAASVPTSTVWAG